MRVGTGAGDAVRLGELLGDGLGEIDGAGLGVLSSFGATAVLDGSGSSGSEVARISLAVADALAVAELSLVGSLVRDSLLPVPWVGAMVAVSSVSPWAADAAVIVCGTAGNATDAVRATAKAVPEIVLNEEVRQKYDAE
ncbi:hypothetical protein [Glutamicibacter nicotianae]|uniref:hypothetical protein n=1 Tax=Glutamicibacter nicotianae TaxID=37929 RepID=UPI002552682D|nr:hypothetical protein [Glutamicibacter nicotianae]WIV45354.1 hypothetical protein QQS42_07125 [Glutamicibacter nicotianae]